MMKKSEVGSSKWEVLFLQDFKEPSKSPLKGNKKRRWLSVVEVQSPEGSMIFEYNKDKIEQFFNCRFSRPKAQWYLNEMEEILTAIL